MYIRFAKTAPTKTCKSYDAFTGTELKGVCCFDIDCDNIALSARKVAEADDTYLKNNDGKFYIFNGHTTQENPNGVGTIAKPSELLIEGRMVAGKYGYVITEWVES